MPGTPADVAAERGAIGYFRLLRRTALASFKALVRIPTHSRRVEAARRWTRLWLVLAASLAVVIVLLMIMLDATAIRAMPPRGSASLWPLRYFTDLGSADYLLWGLGLLLVAAVMVLPLATRRISRAVWASIETRIGFLFLAVAVPSLAGDIFKGVIGRGRPFVGGEANPFFYQPWAWEARFASLPSGHANAAFALAFAVAALWPKTRSIMWTYAVLIALSRVVLLAHHPSDVVAGALTGLLGAMAVQQWFAVRRLGFVIRADGRIEALPGPSFRRIKRVARGLSAS